MTAPDEVAEVVKEAAKNALAAALADDPSAGADAIAAIADAGPLYVQAALHGWATLTLLCVKEPGDEEGGFWGIEAADAKGRPVSLDSPQVAPALRAAFRVLACSGNDDHDTLGAIVQTHWNAGPEELANLMVATVSVTADVVRAARIDDEGNIG